MRFKNKQFNADVSEAFEYWKQAQLNAAPAEQKEDTAKKLATYSLERWIMETMSKPVYELIRMKRMSTE